MAKYCTNCGKKLKEGEVCDCSKNNEQTNIEVSKTLKKGANIAVDFLTKPVETLKKYVEKENFVISVLFIVLAGISTGLFTIAILKETLGLFFGSYDSVFGTLMYEEVNYFKYFILTALGVIGISFLEAGLLLFFTNSIYKQKTNYKQLVNLIAPLSIYTIIGSLIAILGVYISIYVILFILIAFGLMNLIVLTLASKEIIKLDNNKLIYSIVGTKLSTIVIVAIILSIF